MLPVNFLHFLPSCLFVLSLVSWIFNIVLTHTFAYSYILSVFVECLNHLNLRELPSTRTGEATCSQYGTLTISAHRAGTMALEMTSVCQETVVTFVPRSRLISMRPFRTDIPTRNARSVSAPGMTLVWQAAPVPGPTPERVLKGAPQKVTGVVCRDTRGRGTTPQVWLVEADPGVTIHLAPGNPGTAQHQL